MVLLIDNFDSFTYNIYQCLISLNYEVNVKRNNEISVSEIENLNPSHIIISPGPRRPEDAGISLEIIKHFKTKIPILGICLGHQCIGSAFGGDIIRASKLYHGKVSEITHDGKGIFKGIKNGFIAARYHSLVINKTTLPDELEISAKSEDGEIMGVRHKKYNIEGTQFHPESIVTSFGYQIFNNFLNQKLETSILCSAIRKVHSGGDLTIEESEKVMDEITSVTSSPIQISSFLTALSIKGESISEITGFAKIMRRKVTPVKRPVDRKIVDTCGTGGDSSGTFNISTIAAFVTAGAGITVAKHGNRSVTSKCGSGDVLEALGINISVDADVMAESLDKIGMAFLFAPTLHKSMKHAMPVRREIGIRTIFNILGPLTNPANADYQIIGVFEENLVEKIAKVLVNLGLTKAMVVHGSDGLDEITLTGKTKVAEIKNGWIKNLEFDPKDYGFNYCASNDLKGGDIKANKEIALSILTGKKGPKRDIVILNSAAAIYMAKENLSFQEAIRKAEYSIDSGAALEKLNGLIKFTNQ
jgi:anthranilate synthase/phosphoribosyltransferase